MTDRAQPMPDAPELDLQDLYPIREVSRLTGVNPVTLRAWERRYGLLTPHRTDSGHRLYSMADIERVRAVTAWIDRGVAVSKVASIIDRQVAPPRPSKGESASLDATVTAAPDEDWTARLVAAINHFDADELDRVHGQMHATLPLPVCLGEILLPLWRQYLAQAAEPTAQWQFFDAFLRARAYQRLGFARPGQPRVLLATLPGPQREFEVLVAALGAAAAEAQVMLIPGPVALADLQYAAESSGCAAVVLLAERSLDAPVLTRQLPRMEQALECPLAVVGAACDMQPAELERAGLIRLGGSLHGFTGGLRTLLAGRLDN